MIFYRLDDQHWDVWISRESDGSGTVPEPELKVRDFGGHVVRYEGTPPIQISDTPCSTSDGCAGDARSENLTDISYFYTKTILWNTTTQTITDPDGDGPHPQSTLLGHNGAHTIALAEVNNQEAHSLMFQKKDPQTKVWEDANDKVITTTHEVGNLVITDVSTNQDEAGKIADYFKFDPQSENDSFVHPKIRFKFESFDNTASNRRYKWYLYVRATTVSGYSNFLTYEGNVNQPGEVEVSINKESSSYQKTVGADLKDWGTYAFDITIQDTKIGDTVRLRTPYEDLKVAPTLVDIDGHPFKNADGEDIVDENGKPLPGHELVVEEDDRDVEVPLQFFYSYTLRGKKNPSQVKIDLLGPDLSLAATKDGGTGIGEYNYFHLFTASDDVQGSTGSGWKGVLIARDALGENYRDHKNRSALAINETCLQSPTLWFRVTSADSKGSNVTVSQHKIVNDGNPKDGGILSEVGEFPGKGVIPVFDVDKVEFSQRFRSKNMDWNFTIEQGGDRLYINSKTSKNFINYLRGGTPDTPSGVSPTIAYVRVCAQIHQ